MAVRTFTIPNSLNETLAVASFKMATKPHPQSDDSAEAAKKVEESFPAEAKAPLASHTNSDSKPGITFAHQESLPKLPIPELESSAKKYLAALQPLQSPKEYHDTKLAVHDFLKGDGPELQEKLKKYASGRANYIEQFCKYLLYNRSSPWLTLPFFSL
jgi:carnitine O-acetyltransferase